MLLKVFNHALIQDRETTYLTAAAVAADTALTVASTDLAPAATSSNTWANNDYMIVGKIGEEGTEVMQMSAAVTSATSLSIDREGQTGGLRHAHPAGTPIYRIDYNQAQFYRNTTNTTTGASTLATINLQLDDHYTRYEDSTNTTGYGFVRFYNATTTGFSSYSVGINYEVDGTGSSRDPRTLWMLRKRVRKLLQEMSDERLEDEQIDDAVNDRQRKIGNMHLWTFLEDERSFSSVADQHHYALPERVKNVHDVTFDTQPLFFIPRTKWKAIHWNTNTESSDQTHYGIWNRELLVYPRPSAAAASTAINAVGNLSATATSVTVDATSSFSRGDYYRFIIDSEVIYATESTATTFTGLRRGMEGTTAAIHLDNATITERDIVYGAQMTPEDLLDITDRTPLPEPDILAYGAAIDLAPLLGKQEMVAGWQVEWEKELKKMEDKFMIKQNSQFGRVKRAEELLQDSSQILNANLFPRDVG